jgi:uncharacterized membrane protein
MIDFEISILIDRPIHEVFNYISNPLNLVGWQSMVKEVRPVTAGPVAVGAKYTTLGELLGRKLEGELEVSEYEPDTKFGYQGGAGPLRIHGVMTLKPAGTGARVILNAHGEPGGMFKLAEKLLAGQVKSQMEENLERLKSILEAGA